MKKVGIVTVWNWICRNDNYGSVLQAIALQKKIRDCGFDSEIIRLASIQDERFRSSFHSPWYYRLKLPFVSQKKRRSLRRQLARSLHDLKFGEFIADYLKVSPFRLDMKNCETYDLTMYDAVVTGSDQVWVATTPFHFLLPSNLPKNRFAYAVSCNWLAIDATFKSLLQMAQSKLKAIGVREDVGVDICHSLGCSKATWVCDPTLLLTSKEWLNLLKCEAPDEINPILFAYYVRSLPASIDKIFHSLASKMDLVYQKSGVQGAESDLDVNKDCWLTPLEWIKKVASSKVIVTNSFHCICFAILFHRPFVIVPEVEGKKFIRQESLMSRLQLSNRIATTVEEAYSILQRPIDWELVDSALEAFRNESYAFLKQALEE